jgi:hypothetical protein
MPLETSVVSNHAPNFANCVFMYLPKHWHGISQHKSNWADGVAFITQCPLRQEEAFEHKFTPTGQSGTYWYHSHYSTQYCDGLRGPLVIYDPEDPLAYLYDIDDGGLPSNFCPCSVLSPKQKVPLSRSQTGEHIMSNGKVCVDPGLGITHPPSNSANYSHL